MDQSFLLRFIIFRSEIVDFMEESCETEKIVYSDQVLVFFSFSSLASLYQMIAYPQGKSEPLGLCTHNKNVLSSPQESAFKWIQQ